MIDQTAVYPPEFTESIKDLIELLGDRLQIRQTAPSVFVLADENTARQCYPSILEHWTLPGSLVLIEVAAGEGSKDWTKSAAVLKVLSEKAANRSSILLALGGGVITDLGGFLASVYMRGIRFALIPTSLLAMVDASIGGKSGLDVGGAKNLAGLFCRPEAIGVWPGFLKTLPESELRQGMAEMLKHALVASKDHWHSLSGSQESVLREFRNSSLKAMGWIRESARIKFEIVQADPLEKGLRSVLNFGHTVGHAVESALLESGSPIGHGQAVLFGMRVELVLAEALLGFEDRAQVDAVLLDWSVWFERASTDIERMVHWMRFDKKRSQGTLRFALPKKIGEAVFGVECSEDEVRKALKKLW